MSIQLTDYIYAKGSSEVSTGLVSYVIVALNVVYVVKLKNRDGDAYAKTD